MIDRVPDPGSRDAYAKQSIRDHTTYIHRYGEDMPETSDWKWNPDKIIGQGKIDAERSTRGSIIRQGKYPIIFMVWAKHVLRRCCTNSCYKQVDERLQKG